MRKKTKSIILNPSLRNLCEGHRVIATGCDYEVFIYLRRQGVLCLSWTVL
jgi:hypothetical protein